jgi:hypothetical protein
MTDLRSLIDRIRSLLDSRAADPGNVTTDVENTLTDGYAAVLLLEGRRRRIERRISELARTVAGPEEAGELRSLSASLRGTEAELVELRRLLAELRRVSDSRNAA